MININTILQNKFREIKTKFKQKLKRTVVNFHWSIFKITYLVWNLFIYNLFLDNWRKLFFKFFLWRTNFYMTFVNSLKLYYTILLYLIYQPVQSWQIDLSKLSMKTDQSRIVELENQLKLFKVSFSC